MIAPLAAAGQTVIHSPHPIQSNGETVIVDTREGQRRIRGILNNTESNYFKYRSLDSSWLSLAVGTNYLRYNAEEGITNLEVYIRFNPGYLEIDQ